MRPAEIERRQVGDGGSSQDWRGTKAPSPAAAVHPRARPESKVSRFLGTFGGAWNVGALIEASSPRFGFGYLLPSNSKRTWTPWTPAVEALLAGERVRPGEGARNLDESRTGVRTERARRTK